MNCKRCERKGKTVKMVKGVAIHNPHPINVPRGACFVLYPRWDAGNLILGECLKCPECGHSER